MSRDRKPSEASRTVFSISEDVRGAAYLGLIEYLLRSCSAFHLVWRDQAKFDQEAISIREDLSRWELNRRRSSAWPGIRYSTSKPCASVILYKTDPRQNEILKCPGGLFGWVLPKFPEDIGFYDKAGDCCFVTVSHEKEGWFLNADLVSACPVNLAVTEERWSETDMQLLKPATVRL